MTSGWNRKTGAWLGLLLLSAVLAVVLYRLRVPAAFMLGPMLAGVSVALSGAGLRLHRDFTLGAQAVMGCLIAGFISPRLLAVYVDHWGVLVAANVSTMALIVAISILVARRQWLPGATAVWGLFPGAASAMVLLADAHRSDPRVVALMQYSRVILVSLASIAMAALLGHTSGGAGEAASEVLSLSVSWPLNYPGILTTFILALSGYAVARLSGMGALALLLPAFVGALLQGAGLISVDVPSPVFVAAFGITGWYVGLSFTRSAVKHCLRLLPAMLAAIGAIILVCGLLALILVWLVPDIDPLTAYLALSPGGIETVVIIASDADVFLPLILASQFLRLLMVLSLGPLVAKAVAGWLRQA